jgi:EamA domain-containing membrane protein RarD
MFKMHLITTIAVVLCTYFWSVDHLSVAPLPWVAIILHLGFGVFLVLAKEYGLSPKIVTILFWPLLWAANWFH